MSLYLYSQLKTALFPHFSHSNLGILLSLVGVREAAELVWLSLLWEYLRAFRKRESISLSLSGSVGILPSGSGRAVMATVILQPKDRHRIVVSATTFVSLS